MAKVTGKHTKVGVDEKETTRRTAVKPKKGSKVPKKSKTSKRAYDHRFGKSPSIKQAAKNLEESAKKFAKAGGSVRPDRPYSIGDIEKQLRDVVLPKVLKDPEDHRLCSYVIRGGTDELTTIELNVPLRSVSWRKRWIGFLPRVFKPPFPMTGVTVDQVKGWIQYETNLHLFMKEDK